MIPNTHLHYPFISFIIFFFFYFFFFIFLNLTTKCKIKIRKTKIMNWGNDKFLLYNQCNDIRMALVVIMVGNMTMSIIYVYK